MFKPRRSVEGGNLDSCIHSNYKMELNTRGKHMFLRFSLYIQRISVLSLLSDSGKYHNDTSNYIICCLFSFLDLSKIHI